MAINKNNTAAGIVLYAKQPGLTSFTALNVVKKALGTKKVGHTGTLDSFADGLLVVLVGRLTRLVPHITLFDKTYRAVIEFGAETDTLDPNGQVIATASPPSAERLIEVLPQFIGTIQQVPPSYSALHIDGRRASDIIRAGGNVELAARSVDIYSIQLVSYDGVYAILDVRCSKGTYIRSLARDIALACQSRGFLRALRRTAVGPFLLQDAAGYEWLPVFGTEQKQNDEKMFANSAYNPFNTDEGIARLRSAIRPFEPEIASLCGFEPIVLCPESVSAFITGKPLSVCTFMTKDKQSVCFSSEQYRHGQNFAVYYPNGVFGGIISYSKGNLSYGFVIPECSVIK